MSLETMYALFEHKEDLTALAAKLNDAGLRMAAEEIDREARLLGERANQLAGVLDDYRQDIAAIQQMPKKTPHWIGVDRSKSGSDRTYFNGVLR